MKSISYQIYKVSKIGAWNISGAAEDIKIWNQKFSLQFRLIAEESKIRKKKSNVLKICGPCIISETGFQKQTIEFTEKWGWLHVTIQLLLFYFHTVAQTSKNRMMWVRKIDSVHITSYEEGGRRVTGLPRDFV